MNLQPGDRVIFRGTRMTVMRLFPRELMDGYVILRVNDGQVITVKVDDLEPADE